VSETRKLAAILAADVVGYSRLMGADEAGTAKLVRERREAASPIVRSFGGRLVKTTGDGVLLEFPSVVAAVQCAIAIQKMMAERNANIPDAKRILYRMGVNLGDVLIDGEDILGDGVNVAARLEGICEPGGVCLSGSAYDQVRGRIEAEFVDIGEQALKNIALPVRVYTLTPTAIATAKAANPPPTVKARGWWLQWPSAAAALAVVALLAAGSYAWRAGVAPHFATASVDDSLKTAPRLSIVVLPFENLSGDKEQDYFADGITDDLTTDLSHLPDSFVISRSTAYTYKGKPVDAKQIGRELGVRYLLEGSVRRVGDNVEVNAQLISTETGAHAWADRFDGERGNLGELQVQVVSRLANSLGVQLVKAEALRAARERPNNPDAVDLAMQGSASFNNGFGKANLNTAIDEFERALQLDPELARAQVGLAYALVDRAYVFGGNTALDYPRAEALLTTALSKEPNNASVHSARALLAFARKQYSDALSKLDVAIELDPNLAGAYSLRGVSRLFLGRTEEDIPDLLTSLRLSPRDRLRGLWENDICDAYMHLAQWEKAVEWCQKSTATNGGFWWTYANLAAAYGWLGREAEAKVAIDGLHKLKPGFTVQDFVKSTPSDNPQYRRERERITAGLRRAGLPEE
jgi:TolB-like protein/class 3 adenylate cyclase/Flp pilus assembly protein TadD